MRTAVTPVTTDCRCKHMNWNGTDCMSPILVLADSLAALLADSTIALDAVTGLHDMDE